MKRPCDESSSAESDMEETIDVGSESIYPGHIKRSFIRCGSPTTTTQVMARKKRRGIIEKRRRDRINSSLSELRRLVPTAFEKQGSAKLEKAEILQMTVDHLKMLQATGGKGYFDAHALALDFLSLGFRECLGEVSRYLSTVESLDPSDPLPARLLSHLASCASQRDTAAALSSSMVASAAHQGHLFHGGHHLHPHQQPPPVGAALHSFHHPASSHHQHWAAAVATAAAAAAATFHPLPAFGLSALVPVSHEGGGGGGGGGGSGVGGGTAQRLAEVSQRSTGGDNSAAGRGMHLCASFSSHVADSSSSNTTTTPTSSSSSPPMPSSSVLRAQPPLSASLLSLSASFPSVAFSGGFPPSLLHHHHPSLAPSSSSSAASPPISSSSSLTPQSSSSSKPYRPWGTEVGAF